MTLAVEMACPITMPRPESDALARESECPGGHPGSHGYKVTVTLFAADVPNTLGVLRRQIDLSALG